jgi:subtilisin family serine protease
MSKEFFLPPHVVNEYNPILPQSQTIDWGTNVLNIPEIHDMGFKGSGVKVAIIDTGVDKEHPDLVGGVVDIINRTSEGFKATHGHGIGVAGVIGARDNTTGILSPAPLCEMYGIKAMRESGGGSLSEIIKGVEAAIEIGVHVINLSLGTTANVPQFEAVIKKAVNAGIYVICSAGNAGRDNSVVYPARYPLAFAIGATNQAGNVSAFSSRGWEVDIAAPGERVLTSWKNKSYARVSGTSFSAPYVSGLFALFIEAGIAINHNKITSTAIDIEEPGQDTKSGHGLIDPISFIKKYRYVTPAPTPTPVSPSPTPVPVPPVDLSKAEQAYKLLGEYLNK